ncbi:MAG: hypothetical protein ABIP90_00830 [Vicinamibacterales bacterium]
MRAVHRLPSALGALAIATTVVFAPSCGGGSTPNEPSTPPNPTVTNTITISASGVSPQNIQITPGTRVLFRNNDSRSHEMTSDPHPEHTDCPEINQVGLLAPGQPRETGNLNRVQVCRFHDHDLPNNTSLTGVIVIK